MPKKQHIGPIVTAPTREIDVPLPFRIPEHIKCNIYLPTENHLRWVRTLEEAQRLIKDDLDLQRRAAKGLRIPTRKLPMDMLGRMYAQYCSLINRMYESYTSTMQEQRCQYMVEIVAIIMKRMYELRNEMVRYIVNDYIYLDDPLITSQMVPYDIDIIVPYHLPLEARPDSMEQLLQKMWTKAIKRKTAKPKEKKKPPEPVKLTSALLDEFDDETLPLQKPAEEQTEKPEGKDDEVQGEEIEEEESSSSDEDSESVHTVVPPVFTYTLLIQRHERFRQFYLVHYLEKVAHYRQYFRPKFEPPPEELKEKACNMIKSVYRKFMYFKRQRVREHKRDILLGIVPDVDRRPLIYTKEAELLDQRHYKEKQIIKEGLRLKAQKETKRLLWLRKGQLIEDITDEVIEWFKEWYYGYGFFPSYPYELEGGTVMVVNGQYPTIEEQKADDERYIKNTKGKTKEQLKQEREKQKEEEKRLAEAEKEKQAKDRLNLLKARGNPATDPGYNPKVSKYKDEIAYALTKYRQTWSLIDTFPADRWGDAIYGFMEQILDDNIMEKIQYEARMYVDEIMRLELKTFVKAQKAMFQRVEWLWPKQRGRKKPKPPPASPKPFIVDKPLLQKIEPIFDLDIMSRPKSKIRDIIGDFSYIAYEANISDPDARFPPPSYGDIRHRLLISGVFASGLQQPPPARNKALLLFGIPRNGKTFMADCIAGEMNAVKFDVSPDVFCTKVNKPPKYLAMVFQAARVFQPSVIFCKNIERVFYKKVPPSERKERARTLKKPLQKLIKSIPADGKIIFIATCSNPWAAKAGAMMKLFDENILVPWPDYSSIQQYFYWSLQKIRSMPRDFCTQALAHIFKGLGFGAIMEVFHSVLNPERICRLNITRLQQSEFVEYMIMNDIEQLSIFDLRKYIDFALQYSPIKNDRAEYNIINMQRADAYEKLAKVAEEKAKKAAAKAKQA